MVGPPGAQQVWGPETLTDTDLFAMIPLPSIGPSRGLADDKKKETLTNIDLKKTDISPLLPLDVVFMDSSGLNTTLIASPRLTPTS